MLTIYKSELKELQGKEFESVEALDKAEAEVSEKKAEEQKLAETKKSKAESVKAKIVERVEADRNLKQVKREAYQEYLKKVEAAEDILEEKKKAESEAVNDFCKEYGSFHETIKIGDGTYTYSCCQDDYKPVKLSDLFDHWFW